VFLDSFVIKTIMKYILLIVYLFDIVLNLVRLTEI
jgi:hypothetical protein